MKILPVDQHARVFVLVHAVTHVPVVQRCVLICALVVVLVLLDVLTTVECLVQALVLENVRLLVVVDVQVDALESALVVNKLVMPLVAEAVLLDALPAVKVEQVVEFLHRAVEVLALQNVVVVLLVPMEEVIPLIMVQLCEELQGVGDFIGISLLWYV